MQLEASQFAEFFSRPEAYLFMLFLALGFLLGYIVALFLHRARIRELEQRLGADTLQFDADEMAVAGLQGQQAALQETLRTRNHELERLRQELAQSRQVIDKVEAEKDQLYNEIYAINAEVEKLNAAEASYAATIDQLNQQIHDLKSKNEALQQQSQDPDMPVAAAGLDSEQAARQRSLQQQLNQALEQLEVLRDENRDLREQAEPSPRQVSPLQPYHPVNGQSPTASDRDDLTLVKGIGPFLQRKLNALGVRRFEDISDMDPERVRSLSRELRLVEGRIETENWLGQARHLQSLKLNDPEAFRELATRPTDQTKLQVIEGIGSQIEELLHQAGIQSWDQLADTPVERLRSILRDSGSTFQTHDPATWPIQATLAANGHWKLLEEYQERLQGGRDMTSPRN